MLLFLKLMFDMSRTMKEMIGYAGTISQDVCETQASGIPVHNNPTQPCPVIAENMTNELT